MELDAPDPLPLLHVRHLEQDVRANAALEGRVHVGGEVGREDDDAGKGLELVQQHVDDRVGLAVDGRLHRGEAPARDGVGLVEEEHGVLPLGGAEHRGHVLGGLPHPPRFQLGVPDHQQLPMKRVGQRFGADGLAGARRAGEVERQAEPRRVPLGEPPLSEDEIVLPHERQRVVQRLERPLRQDHVVERALGLDCFDQLTGRRAEEEVADGIGHVGR